jgi:hypothetical protein
LPDPSLQARVARDRRTAGQKYFHEAPGMGAYPFGQENISRFAIRMGRRAFQSEKPRHPGPRGRKTPARAPRPVLSNKKVTTILPLKN